MGNMKIKDNNPRLGLSKEQLNYINNNVNTNESSIRSRVLDSLVPKTMNKEMLAELDKVANFTVKEMNQVSIDHNKLLLEQAIKISRTEPFGYSIEEMADVITDSLEQTESQALIDKLVIFHGKKFGQRLFR